ncbi:MAG: lactoylglutathione lyase [Acidobacteria bacterium]|nr:MAG: lactoylglutathione lyase [Acidobacteriota bacterium]PIE89119.1 MAG: lactoylglutathione lyase [Acidobacteriota bacterium]
MNEVEFILYVRDQNKSRAFYERLLNIKPFLDVLGMTEFKLAENIKLGLMPENGISKIILDKIPHPNTGSGIPRCELYLKVNNPLEYIARAFEFGGMEISKLQEWDRGDKVGCISDLDGHIIAFAEKRNNN